MSTPKISVIVPVYNVENYLPYCIESIIKQTYKNIEIILINDGSTDNSLQLCNKYKKHDRRIKVIDQKNKGLSGARNSGINVATGDYFSFIDSDDFVAQDYLEYLLSMMEQGVNITTCQSKIAHNYNESNIVISQTGMGDEAISVHDYCVLAFNNVRYLSAWGKLYKRELFDTIRFPEGILNEDIFIMAELFDQTSKIGMGKEIKYYYVKRKDSITTARFNKRKFDLIEANSHYTSEIIKRYPNLIACSKAYEIHARSSLIKQIPYKEKDEYKDYISCTISMARKYDSTIRKDPFVSKKEKILCKVTATNFIYIKLCWKIFEAIKK